MRNNNKGFTLTPKNFGVSSQSERGFTLIELLVVIAIIGLLSTLAVVSLNSARQKSRDAKRVADIKQLQTALELHYNDVGTYPVETAAVTLGTGAGLTLSSGSAFNATPTGTTYMTKVPINPTPGGASFIYAISTGTTYSISFTLEADMASLGGDVCTATPAGVACT